MERLRGSLLQPFVEQYVAQLAQQGYKSQTARHHVQFFARFDRWLRPTARRLRDLRESELKRFVVRHPLSRRAGQEGLCALCRLLELLRAAGVTRVPSPRPPTAAQRLADEFRHYLASERGLAAATVAHYGRHSERFLAEHFGRGPVVAAQVRAPEVIGFVRRQARRYRPGGVRLLTSALRSFLRFLRYEGHLATDLVPAVPAVATWRWAGLPQGLPAQAVQRVLDRGERTTAVGRRNYAMVVLLARLGLRAAEVMDLQLHDIDWPRAQLTIRSKKGGPWARWPLSAEVGQALAQYLRYGRPRSSSPQVFVRTVAPHVALASSGAVGWVARRALAQAGIKVARPGAHVFRHSLATEMLRQGASLDQIAQVLRHKDPDTTALYAKVDLEPLRRLTVAWPGGER